MQIWDDKLPVSSFIGNSMHMVISSFLSQFQHRFTFSLNVLFHHYTPRDDTLSAHVSVSIEVWNDKKKIPLRASCNLCWKNKTYYTVLEVLEAVKL